MTLTKNLLGEAMDHLLSSSDQHWYDGKIVLLCAATCIILLPLALKRKVTALRYSSLFGLCAFIFMVAVVVAIYFVWCEDANKNSIRHPNHPHADHKRECLFDVLVHTKAVNAHFLDHTYTIAIFMAGFCPHPTILPIYYEMQRRSPSRMTNCLIYGFSFTFIMYFIIAYAGYFTFPTSVKPNLVTSAYHSNQIILFAEIFLALYVLAILPLFAHSFRKSVAEFLIDKHKQNVQTQNQNQN
jgi:amino acid permease